MEDETKDTTSKVELDSIVTLADDEVSEWDETNETEYSSKEELEPTDFSEVGYEAEGNGDAPNVVTRNGEAGDGWLVDDEIEDDEPTEYNSTEEDQTEEGSTEDDLTEEDGTEDNSTEVGEDEDLSLLILKEDSVVKEAPSEDDEDKVIVESDAVALE